MFNRNKLGNMYDDALLEVGNKLIGSWGFKNSSIFLNDYREILLANKIHSVDVDGDIRWYICNNGTKRNTLDPHKPHLTFFLIEVNGELCEDCVGEDLSDIISDFGNSSTVYVNQITKAYWGAIEEIKMDLIENPIHI